MPITRLSRRELVALALILLLAAGLRLGWPGITEFKLDEAQIARLSLDLAEGRAFPLSGIGTSVGLPKPALSVYLYAVPLLLWRSPLAATLFTGLVNVAAVFLCWWLGRRYWGPVAGLSAALFFAASPWAVLHSRKIWEPNLLPAFGLGCLITGLLAFVEGRRRALAAHILLLAVFVQLHYYGAVYVPLFLALLLIYRRRLDWRAGLVGLALGAATAVPFGVYLFRHRREVWQTAQGLLGQPARVDGDSFRLWWTLFTGREIHSLAGPQAYQEYLRSVPNLDILAWLMGLLAMAGVAYWLWRAVRRTAEAATPQTRLSTQAGVVLALWALIPPIFLARHATPVFLHYLIVALPAPYLAAGFVVARALSSKHRPLRWGAGLVQGAIVVGQVGLYLALLAFVGQRATPDGFGVPYRDQAQAARQARARGAPVVVLAPGDDPRTSNWAAVFDVLLRDTPHRLVDGALAQAAVFPTGGGALLFAPGVEAVHHVYAQAGVLDTEHVVPARVGEEPFRVARSVGTPALALQPTGDAPHTFSNGAEVVGYRLDGALAPGKAATWWIAWRVAQAPPDRGADYHWFNHLVDDGGQRLTQADGGTVAAKDWALGDLVMQPFRLELPAGAAPGPYWVRVGMYTYPNIQNQPVLDAAGNPAADSVKLGPLP